MCFFSILFPVWYFSFHLQLNFDEQKSLAESFGLDAPGFAFWIKDQQVGVYKGMDWSTAEKYIVQFIKLFDGAKKAGSKLYIVYLVKSTFGEDPTEILKVFKEYESHVIGEVVILT